MKAMMWAKIRLAAAAVCAAVAVGTGGTVAVTKMAAAEAGDGIGPVKPAVTGCPIVPAPKEYKETGGTAKLSERAAIVIGAGATEPEKYAAERLQKLVERRFKRKLPILTEDKAGGAEQVIALGQASTNGLVKRLCADAKINMAAIAAKGASKDGFAIEAAKGKSAILVAGSNPRGVTYGADAFFDLLRTEKGQVVLPAVSIRDWPSIPWRGRAWHQLREYLRPRDLDAYVRSRLNFVDVRDGAIYWSHTRDKGGPFGIPPGFGFDKAVMGRTIDEAHRRGLFVYGTVSCGVRPDKFDAAVKTFEELVALGVDGLWISFDDPGPGREAAVLIGRVLELGRKHGIIGREIAITPPTGSYQKIVTDFNRAAAKIPGFEQATWFFTRVPSAKDVTSAREIGLESLPAWWHNWPRIGGGFLHNRYVGASLRVDRKPAYMELVQLARGWGRPSYKGLRGAHQHTDTVLMWGNWAPEYVTAVLGIWAWNPAGHDWSRTGEAIYRYAFGPGQAGAAREFDDKLVRLKRLFDGGAGRGRGAFLCRLKKAEEEPVALKLLEELDRLLKILEAQAPKETLIDGARLTKFFLEPMRATVGQARGAAGLNLALFAGDVFRERMLRLVESGKLEEAGTLLAETRKSVAPNLPAAEEALNSVRGGDRLAKAWRAGLAGLDYWKKEAERVRAERERKHTAEAERRARDIRNMPNRFKKLTGGDFSKHLAKIGNRPEGKVLAEIKPAGWSWQTDPPSWKGMFAVGRYESKGAACVAIAFPAKTSSKPGDYAEVRAELAVPKFEGKLILEAFVNDTYVTTKWTGYRFMQLWVNGRKVWEEDIASSRQGREWVSVGVTEAAKGSGKLLLHFRVTDRKSVGNYTTVTFLGPVRLRGE